jgi:hypothetical protein
VMRVASTAKPRIVKPPTTTYTNLVEATSDELCDTRCHGLMCHALYSLTHRLREREGERERERERERDCKTVKT